MARTKIDVQGVINANGQINSAKRTVNSIRDDLDWTRGQISSSILNRSNLQQRLRNVSNSLRSVENRMNRIKVMVENGANSYKNTDRRVATRRASLSGKVAKKNVFGVGYGPIVSVGTTKQTTNKGKIEEWEGMSPEELWEEVVDGVIKGGKRVQAQIEKLRKDIKREIDIAIENSKSKEVLPSLERFYLINDFIDSRNPTKDAILFGLTRNLLDGFKSLVNSATYRDDMTDEAYKSQIFSIVEETKKNSKYINVGKELLEEYEGKVVAPINEWNQIDEIVKNNNEKYKYLESIDAEAFDKLGDLLKYGQEGVEVIEILVSDYASTIETLELMKQGLEATGGNPLIIQYVDEMIYDYNHKFGMLVDKALEIAIDEGVDSGFQLVSTVTTGGLLSVAEMSHDIIWNYMDLTEKGDVLAQLYASSKYSNDVVCAYEHYADILRTGKYTEEDYVMCKTMFELSKELKIQEYENIKTFSTKDSYEYIDEQISTLYSLQLNFEM